LPAPTPEYGESYIIFQVCRMVELLPGDLVVISPLEDLEQDIINEAGNRMIEKINKCFIIQFNDS